MQGDLDLQSSTRRTNTGMGKCFQTSISPTPPPIGARSYEQPSHASLGSQFGVFTYKHVYFMSRYLFFLFWGANECANHGF